MCARADHRFEGGLEPGHLCRMHREVDEPHALADPRCIGVCQDRECR
jgi:hypothetical protein